MKNCGFQSHVPGNTLVKTSGTWYVKKSISPLKICYRPGKLTSFYEHALNSILL